MHVLVLGGGVSGLSSGIRLLEAGHTVELWARELTPHTTSDVAAAVWYPYRAFPQERGTGWARRTFDVLCELAPRVHGQSPLHSAPPPEQGWPA